MPSSFRIQVSLIMTIGREELVYVARRCGPRHFIRIITLYGDKWLLSRQQFFPALFSKDVFPLGTFHRHISQL